MALINFQDVTLSYGGPNLLDNINFQIHEGEKITLLGRNGAGKSTLMNIINGMIEPDSGEIFREKNLRTAMLQQDVPDDISGSIYEIITKGIIDNPDDIHDAALEKKHIAQIEKVLSLMSLDPAPEFNTLSAGMKRRVLLARALVNEPDILLLDEPTNHLDIDSIRWLEDFLARYDGTLFFVTHDRAFMQKVANRILEIDRGNLFDWKCDYKTFLQRKEAWLDAEEQQNALFDKKLAQEEIWIRKGIKARRTRNEGRVRALKAMRVERSKRIEQQGKVKLDLNQAERSGKLVIEAEDISFGYTDKLLVKDFSTTIMRGDKIGIIGPNGCGKSTMIKLLLGQLQPDGGSVRQGTRLEVAYFDQLRDQLDPEKSVRYNVSDGTDMIEVAGRTKHVIGYLQDFLFTPDRADVKVSVLSGGEKNRLMLARLFTKPFNLLIMDEPTNDLDIETVELLEELLLEYEGTLITVSHDREFLNNVVTSSIVFDSDGSVREYAGGYDDWLLQRPAAVKEIKEKKTRPEKKSSDKIKMTFKEKRELEALPELIAEKEKRKEELVAIISDPEFFKKNAHKSVEINREIEAVNSELESLFERWMELEEKSKYE
ncbi:MAG TPA: ATP-binding cassette domain-containing protein [Spirochaetota bacterium]|nr:ATP-binding cassette domain-containing protein [Spirochaetota bacterium]HPF06327.1 ATP-binding cassette domain-containing protein [Spirochaetota bacterium]HPJ40925.1 ATP-binding cassette domain-containing protein [Spirochaetota bacterium]HPR39132.1 ATP-binding cassette domain-containing protein [Spirochaetota bacterium]